MQPTKAESEFAMSLKKLGTAVIAIVFVIVLLMAWSRRQCPREAQRQLQAKVSEGASSPAVNPKVITQNDSIPLAVKCALDRRVVANCPAHRRNARPGSPVWASPE